MKTIKCQCGFEYGDNASCPVHGVNPHTPPEGKTIACPECGGTEWVALEGATVIKRVSFDLDDNGLIIDTDPFSKFEVDSQTTTILAYKCAWQLCPFQVNPDKMEVFVRTYAK